MAKGRRAPQVIRDRFINKVRGRIAFAAVATNAAYEDIPTGINVGQANPFKWVLHYAFVQPAGTGDMGHFAAVNDFAAQFQLSLGQQVDLLEPDDAKVISTVGFSCDFASTIGSWFKPQSAWHQAFPIKAALPIFSQHLTICCKSSADVAGIQSTDWYYELGYTIGGIQPAEIAEYMAAYGQA